MKAPSIVLYALMYTSLQCAEAVHPEVSGTPKVLGIVQDPIFHFQRDSCGSVRSGNRRLWTCRDTMPVNVQGFAVPFVWSNSAAWTHFNKDGTPQLAQFGRMREPFYTLKQKECGSNTASGCSDETRYMIWPASPVMVTHDSATNVLGYTSIKDAHITYSMESLIANPAHFTLSSQLGGTS
jgi:hypothetical protein